MPKDACSGKSAAWKKMYEGIKTSCLKDGGDEDECQRIAAATANKKLGEAVDGSLEKETEDLRNALTDAKLFPVGDNGYPLFYIRWTFDNSLIVSSKEKLYKVPYSKTADGYKFESPVEVEEKTTIQMKEAKPGTLGSFAEQPKHGKFIESCQLLEAKDDTGWTWRARLIKSGLSENKTYYPAKVLREATHLYNGVRALVRSDAEHLRDENKNPKNVVGWYENVEFNEAAQAIDADFQITEDNDWLRTKLMSASKKNKMDIVGFSHVAEGDHHFVKHEGHLVRWADRIDKVDSVDVVVNPAAGGQVLKMVAAASTIEVKEIEMFEHIFKFLETVMKPDDFKKLDQANPDPEKIVEALKGCTLPQDVKDKLVESLKPAAPAPKIDPAPAKKADEDAMSKVEKLTCRSLLAEAMAESTLPKATKDKVRKMFTGKIFTEAELSEALRVEEEYLGSLEKAHSVSLLGDQSRDSKVRKDESDRLVEAFDGLTQGKKIGTTEPFISIREAYRMITGDQSFSGRLREAKGLSRFTESVDTTTWPQIVENTVNKAMLAAFKELPYDDWRKIVTVTPLSDFRTNTRIRMGGYGSLPTVAEGGTYNPLTSPADEKETYTPAKKGGTEDVTWECIRNDDVRAWQRIPRALAYAGKRTLYEAVFDTFVTNAAMGDGIALFHASSHGANLGTTAFSAAALAAARLIMIQQKELTSDKRLGILPKFLLHPSDLHKTVHEVLDSEYKTGSGTGDLTVQVVRMYNIEPIEVVHWTDPNDWFLSADPRECPTLEVGFLDNKQEPELFIQDMPTVGSMFNADKITLKIRFIWGIGTDEWRGLYRSTVT